MRDGRSIIDDYILEREVKLEMDNDKEWSESSVDQLAQESRSHAMLRDQLLNILFVGRDTTACFLSWTLSVPLLPLELFEWTRTSHSFAI